MLKKQLFFFILCLCPYLINAQVKRDSTKKTLIIGASFTYIWNFKPDPFRFEKEYVFHESTLNLNLGYQLHENFRLGITGMQIKTNTKYTEKETQYIVGASFKYVQEMAYKNDFFVETGFYRGNYCTCRPEDSVTFFDVPYKKDNLTYWGLGAGVEIKLARHWQLDLGFYNYLILDNFPQKYNFTQYVIGIDFVL